MNIELLDGCTFTGVDAWTDPAHLNHISQRHPKAEWGFLWDPELEGANPRYMRAEEIVAKVHELAPMVPIALHVCGQGVNRMLGGDMAAMHLAAMVIERGGRIQLNLNLMRAWVEPDLLEQWISQVDIPVITQHFPANELLLGLEPANHHLLVDASRGKGISPSRWEAPPTAKPFGFAGGLSPANLGAHLPRLCEAAGTRRFWIDMETGVRTAERFDLDKVGAVLSAVALARSGVDIQRVRARALRP